MQAWWESLSNFQQIMFVIAVPATLIMLIFLIMMIVGMDGSEAFGGDIDVDISDFDGINDEPLSSISGLKLLSFRNVLTFLSIGSWVAYVLDNYMNSLWAGLIGIVAGALAAFLLTLAFKASLKLESEGNIDYRNAIGKTGVVYIRVPSRRNGVGKVNVIVQERYVEVDAITDDEVDLKTGSNVEIVDVFNDNTVIVTKR